MGLTIAIKRKFKMGIFRNLAKIEELLEANIPGCWSVYHNVLRVKDLPKEMRDVMIKFGYTDKGLIFAVDYCDVHDGFDGKPCILGCVGWGGKDEKDEGWKNLLYRDVDRDWRFTWSKEDCPTNEKLLEAIDKCYRNLQRFFMFMSIYLKQRAQMVKLINIEWDEVISSTKE